MIRLLFNTAAVTSLFLCSATCVLWSRSYAWTDQVVWTRDDGRRSLRSAPGQLVLNLCLHDRSTSPADHGVRYAREEARPPVGELLTVLLLCYDPTAHLTRWETGGFAWSKRSSSRDVIATAVAPFWSVAAATALPPFAWVGLRFGRRRRTVPGVCPGCGYDLRATPHRCPECGRVCAT